MSTWLVWLLVGLGLGAVGVRRAPLAACLVTAQTYIVGIGALSLAPGRSREFAVAGALLVAKAVVVSVIIAVGIARGRDARPHGVGSPLLVRVGGSLALVLAFVALIPAYGLESRAAEHAATAMVATALALVLARRATLFAVLAFLIAENGIALAAVSAGGALPLVVELGVAFDVVVLIAVAAVFQSRILGTFGTTDSAALRGTRD